MEPITIQPLNYIPEFKYTAKYGYKRNPCGIVEVKEFQIGNKRIVIATDLTSLPKNEENEKLPCKMSITNSVEWFIRAYFNLQKEKDPSLRLADFIWIERYTERGTHREHPESLDLVFPIEVEYDNNGFIVKAKPKWKYLWKDDLNKEKRKGITIEEIAKLLKEKGLI